MSNFPSDYDDDLSIPPVFNNITEIGEETIQAIRSAVFAIESEIGIGASGTMGSISNRLNVSINPDGTISPASLIGIGLVALPITNDQISATAAIEESKLNLIYSTQFLYNLFVNLDAAVDILNGFVSVTGIKVEPHIAGIGFRHELSHIDMDSGVLNRVDIDSGTVLPRTLTNAYLFASELSNDLLKHIRADKLSNTTTPPFDQAHNASGIYINSSNFISVPQIANDLQSFAEFVDSSSLILLGSRTQNLYSNGIPRASRNISWTNNAVAESLVDPTPATAYLLYSGATNPVDDVDHGDDVILLNPTSGVLSTNNFDAQFSQVKPGDYITVNYGDGYVPVQFTIDSTKKFLNGSTRVYTVRIHGKNLVATEDAIIRIDRAFYHESKFNGLALAAAQNEFAEMPSLIISNPGGAAAIGLGFDPDKLDRTHYNLYLNLYPTGNPAQQVESMPAIDVTGDLGSSIGSYTLQSVVDTINDKFREPGFNYRFIAYAYNGQLGIALADKYNDASFSIISGTVDGYGDYTASSNASYTANVIDNFNTIDPLGFGLAQANIGSPPFAVSYSTPLKALQAPTIIFAPLRKNFYYVNGVERDDFSLETFTTRDGYGDGYWLATLQTRQALSGRVETTYLIDLDLSTSGLAIGKTLVVQPAVSFDSPSYNSVDYGRFIINNVSFDICPDSSIDTTITVYDAIHGVGASPSSSSVNIPVLIYFSNDSVSFNEEHVSDPLTNVSFKRFFEVYVDTNGDSFTHERARFNTNGSNIVVDSVNGFTLYSSSEMSNINIVDVSPKLRGFTFKQYKKITLRFTSYDEITGVFTGNLSKYEFPSTYTHVGPTITGKKGEVVRFYDDTNIDYIDINIPLSLSLSTFTNKQIDIQLFPSLQLNQEKILIGTCQLQDTSKTLSYVRDKRQFGNVSEKQLSTSALSYISAPQRLLDENGVIRGFDLVSSVSMVNDNKISVKGGIALIDGKLVDFNDTVAAIPIVREVLYPSFGSPISNIRWYLCVNSIGEFEFIASTDYALSLVGTYGSLDHNRIFYVKSPTSISGLAYPIRGTYFHKLLSEYKDLVPLYVVDATVGFDAGAWKVTSAFVFDLRRHVEKGYHGLDDTFTLGQSASFRTVPAVLTYLKELFDYVSFDTDKRNTYGSVVKVRDRFDISNVTFDLNYKVKFVGDSGTFITSAAQAIVTNVEFKDLNFEIGSANGISVGGDNVIIDNCNINYTYDATADGSFVTANLGNVAKGCVFLLTGNVSGQAKNIEIKNCVFTSEFENRYPFITVLFDGNTHYVENLIIDNNRIETTFEADDKRAAIVISSFTTSSPSSQVGPKLVNGQITRNVCNKNQMILMSGETNGSNKIANMVAPCNVLIEKNVCGAICYLTRQDRSTNTYNTTRINDKENMLIISSNSCRYIYNGTNLGFFNVVGQIVPVIESIIVGSSIFSSSTIIEKNSCSWIHVGLKTPTSYDFETPILDIYSNKLSAYDIAFLDDYHSVISPSNIGLLVSSIAGT